MKKILGLEFLLGRPDFYFKLLPLMSFLPIGALFLVDETKVYADYYALITSLNFVVSFFSIRQDELAKYYGFVSWRRHFLINIAFSVGLIVFSVAQLLTSSSASFTYVFYAAAIVLTQGIVGLDYKYGMARGFFIVRSLETVILCVAIIFTSSYSRALNEAFLVVGFVRLGMFLFWRAGKASDNGDNHEDLSWRYTLNYYCSGVLKTLLNRLDALLALFILEPSHLAAFSIIKYLQQVASTLADIQWSKWISRMRPAETTAVDGMTSPAGGPDRQRRPSAPSGNCRGRRG